MLALSALILLVMWVVGTGILDLLKALTQGLGL